jgi:hypothetical protein
LPLIHNAVQVYIRAQYRCLVAPEFFAIGVWENLPVDITPIRIYTFSAGLLDCEVGATFRNTNVERYIWLEVGDEFGNSAENGFVCDGHGFGVDE